METRSVRRRVVGTEPDNPPSPPSSTSSSRPLTELRTIKTDQDLQDAIQNAIQHLKAYRSDENCVEQTLNLLQACNAYLQADPTRRQLQSIKTAVKGLATTVQHAPNTENNQQPQTWAKVAAGRLRPVDLIRPRVNPMRSPQGIGRIVTIRPNTEIYETLTHKEILMKIKPNIQKAIAVEKLRSGDIRITLQDEIAKETLLRNDRDASEQLKAKILRQDYPIEIQAVSVKAIQVDCTKTPNNTGVIKELIKDNKNNIPGLEITRINWIHGAKSLKARQGKEREPKAASLIVWVPNQDLQKQMYSRGLAISGRMHNTRLYDAGLQILRCYKCNKWGHTQGSCRARIACGHCAKGHNTEECQSKEDQNAVKCVNCGGSHPAWAQNQCPEYAKRVAYRESLRHALAEREAQIDIHSHQDFPTLQTASMEANKRARNEAEGERTRAPGRPRKLLRPTAPSQRTIIQTFTSQGNRRSQPVQSQTASRVVVDNTQPIQDAPMVDYQVPSHE
jgi:hypothetical protein